MGDCRENIEYNRVILGYIGVNGKENGNCYSMVGLHWGYISGQWKREWKLQFGGQGLGLGLRVLSSPMGFKAVEDLGV